MDATAATLELSEQSGRARIAAGLQCGGLKSILTTSEGDVERGGSMVHCCIQLRDARVIEQCRIAQRIRGVQGVVVHDDDLSGVAATFADGSQNVGDVVCDLAEYFVMF